MFLTETDKILWILYSYSRPY